MEAYFHRLCPASPFVHGKTKIFSFQIAFRCLKFSEIISTVRQFLRNGNGSRLIRFQRGNLFCMRIVYMKSQRLFLLIQHLKFSSRCRNDQILIPTLFHQSHRHLDWPVIQVNSRIFLPVHLSLDLKRCNRHHRGRMFRLCHHIGSIGKSSVREMFRIFCRCHTVFICDKLRV